MKNKIKDLSGQTIGMWEVLYITKNNKNKSVWFCRCVCGTEKTVEPASLLKGHSKSCGKCGTIKRTYTARKIKNIIGKKYYHLTVTALKGKDVNNNDLVECLCDCGNTTIIKRSKLYKKNVSCGCTKTVYKVQSLIGKNYGSLLVIAKSSERQYNQVSWTCICTCGNTCDVAGIRLRSGEVKSCGCKRSAIKVQTPLNIKINMLTVVEEVESKTVKYKSRIRHIRYVKCKCDCGTYKIVQLKHFKSGKYKSCGCLNKKPTYNLTNKTIKNWKVIKQEDACWWCVCTICGETRIFSYNNLYKKYKLQCSCTLRTIKNIPNFVGESYGNLVVIKNIDTYNKNKKVECLCTCGNTINTTIKNLKNGALKDCGCDKINKKLEEEKQLNMQIINRKFGRLLVISKCAKRYKYKNIRANYWLCLCNCGKIKIVSSSNLLTGNTQSCGCLQFEVAYQGIHFGSRKQKERNKIMNTKEYKIWRKEVFKRDNNTCQICGSTKNIVVHHLLSFSKNIKHRFNLNNGVTLCANCHNKFHEIYTSTNFNINNFIEFKNSSTTT